ncbi:MAG: hypothetical protein M0D57_05040 [Sphingobacteriales bacterium JAD_PAG50586_3]|nr:MAG: hypothetical protein M0D57_05040 [Sphingobacteriales bacterium JAD_PAG50586_3]
MEELKSFWLKFDSSLNWDKQLPYVFFITFSRFEFALKNCKYCKIGNADADWNKFAGELKLIFDETKNEELDKAVEYIKNHPPQKQVYDAKALGWKATIKDAHLSLVEWLLLMIRRIRNNLFHGGQYGKSPLLSLQEIVCCLIMA